MKNSIFIKKEIKSTEILRNLVLLLFLTIFLCVFFVSQLVKLKIKYDLSVDGLLPLIHHLLQDDRSLIDISDMIFNIGFGMSLIVYSVYVGFPYVLSAYERNKTDGTLLHLMIMPVRVIHIVLKYALFGFFKTILMAVITFILFGFLFFVLNPHALFEFTHFKEIVGLSAFSLLSMIIVTCLLWIFNGSKMIISIYRWSALGMIIVLMSLMGKVGINFSIMNEVMIFIILALTVISSVCCFLVEKFFDKEKVIIYLSK